MTDVTGIKINHIPIKTRMNPRIALTMNQILLVRLARTPKPAPRHTTCAMRYTIITQNNPSNHFTILLSNHACAVQRIAQALYAML